MLDKFLKVTKIINNKKHPADVSSRILGGIVLYVRPTLVQTPGQTSKQKHIKIIPLHLCIPGNYKYFNTRQT